MRITVIFVAMVWLCSPAFVLAQPAEALPEQKIEATEQTPRVENSYRIGLACEPISAPLRTHLQLPENNGLLVNSVMADSPATQAGLKIYDVVVEADGKSIGTVWELVEVVNRTQGKPMKLAIIREGQSMVVEVTPEKRPADEIARPNQRIGNELLDQLPPELAEQLRKYEAFELPGEGQLFRRLLPGFDMNKGPFPGNMRVPGDMRGIHGDGYSIQVERQDNGKAKITVQRGDKKWTVNEDELDKLPDEELRQQVKNFLDGGKLNLAFPPGGPETPDLKTPNPLQDRVQGLELQLKDLQDAIESMQNDK